MNKRTDVMRDFAKEWRELPPDELPDDAMLAWLDAQPCEPLSPEESEKMRERVLAELEARGVIKPDPEA